MKNAHDLNVIYNYLPITREGEVHSFYKIVMLFSSIGEISQSVIDKTLLEVDLKDGYADMSFESLVQLQAFVNKLATALGADNAYLLSAGDYNLALENCNDATRFREIFKQYGTHLSPETINDRKSSILKKIFN